MTIKQLERALRLNDKDRIKLHKELDALREKKALPKLKAQFQGKYFKYDNGYDSSTRWPIYSYCHEVTGEDEAIADMFELDPHEGYRFKYRAAVGLYLFAQIVDQKEYDKAAIKVVSAAQGLIELKD